VSTGATYLQLSSTSCTGGYGYTDYEEWGDLLGGQDEPNWAFSFVNNLAGGYPEYQWNYMQTSQSQVTLNINGDNLQVLNEQFGLSTTLCGSGQDMCSITLPLGQQGTVSGTVLKFVPGAVGIQYLSAYALPTGYKATFSPSGSFLAGSGFTLTLTTPSSGCPSAAIGIEATGDAVGSLPAPYTTYRFQVWISGCGGGCVAWGTPILTPTGYVPVQKLRFGNLVEEFDFTTQSLMVGTFLSGNTSNVSMLVDVDHGLLYLTPTEQPIYIQNSTFQGWLRDPQNLTTADNIFDPVTITWIPVTSVKIVNHEADVFDVVTNEVNDFVANGALLDKKT